MTKQPGVAVRLLSVLACHGLTTIACGLVFIAAMNLPPFTGIAILFYRGIIALVASAVVVVALLGLAARRWPSLPLGASDLVSAGLVAVALNLCVFTLGPVTVDRSISVFMLSRFDRADRALSARVVNDDFLRYYGAEWDQIGRRLSEQTASGNIERTPDGYRLTAQGKAFMRTARLMARVFATDPRFVGLDDKSPSKP